MSARCEMEQEALTALRYMSEGYDNHFNAGTPLMALHVAELDAALAEQDKMLRLASESIVLYRQTPGDWLADLRARAEEGDDVTTSVPTAARHDGTSQRGRP